MKEKGKMGKDKKKRWAKHGSCLSNPQQTRFREAVGNRFFKPSGPSALTEEALKRHDGGEEEEAMEGLQQEGQGPFDARTFHTWATHFTDCTNMTFSRVHKLWNSNNSLHKEILALLASITEVIKEKGGSGSNTEYFAALMTFMETAKTLESVTSGAVLMNMSVKAIPVSTLKRRFPEISKLLLENIGKCAEEYADSEHTTLLKSLLMTLAMVLKAQDIASWVNSSTSKTFQAILHYTLTNKPRVRKAARQAVKMVLISSPEPSAPFSPHPASIPTADFCVSTIKNSGKLGASDMDLLHILNLLQDVMGCFPQREIMKAAESVLKLMFINKPVIKANGMAALHSLFHSKPSATSLPAEQNAQIINALYDHQPKEHDSGLMPAWLAVMEQAHLNLSRLNCALCVDFLPQLLAVAMKCLLSHHKDVRVSALKLMNLLLKECIGSVAEGEAEKLKKTLAGDSADSWAHRVVRVVEGGLGFEYNVSWDLVMQLLATVMEVLGKFCPSLLKRCLESLAALRDSVNFGFKGEVDTVLGKAVRSMGPMAVLDAVPLRISGSEDNPDLSRSWLLPVVRDNVSHTELSSFATYFLPLATRFKQKAKELVERGLQAASKIYEALELQLWSMLKGFCTRPTDLPKSFKGLAKMLGSALTDRPDLQMDIMAALRMLVNFSQDKDAERRVMCTFAKNYLPILFNLYTSDPDNPRDSRRLAALETIKVYLTVADSKLVFSFLDMCTSKTGEGDIAAFRKIALMDLAVAMVKYADQSRLVMLYSLAEQNIKASDKTLQKKAYRMLEELCVCSAEECRQFLSSHLVDIQQRLLDSLSTSAPSTKSPRLRCLTSICQHLTEPNTAFIQAVLPEAILCTRGTGERVRAAAYHLIVVISQAMLRWNPEAEEQEVLSQFVGVVLAGLSGSPDMMCATLLALTRIMSHYREKLSSSTLSSMLSIVCLLLGSERREVVKSALEFLRLFIGAYSREVLLTHLSEMVKGICSMKDEARRPCHMKIKQIFKKLIKKFGYEAVQKLSSPKVQLVLQKANSEVKQEKKKKEQEKGDKGDDGDDTNDDEDEPTKHKPETLEEILQFSDMEEEDEERSDGRRGVVRGKTRHAFLVEGGGEVLDILDKSAASKVMASKPKSVSETANTKDKEDPHGGFKLASDGRLIITDKDEKKKGEVLGSDEEDLDDMFAMYEGLSDKKRRKRLREDDDQEDEPANKYKPGGTGIHRPLKKKAEYGAEYKSKKGAGDIKKSGKHEPYTYVPLELKNLNKRKQAKLKGQFSGLVKGAKKGANKGMQMKRSARKAAQKHAMKKK